MSHSEADAAAYPAMRGLVDIEMHIPLAQVPQTDVNQPANKAEYFKMIHESYTNWYLTAIGIEPNERFRKLVAKNAPLEECDIEATWTDDSYVANCLRINQPIIAKKRKPPEVPVSLNASVFSPSASSKQRPSRASPEAREDRVKTVKVVPPEVPTSATVDRLIGKAGTELHNHSEIFQKERELALQSMQQTDADRVDADPRLTDKLERIRKRTRKGLGEGESEELTLVQWGEDGDRELATLKRKFILPFAAERPAPGSVGGTHLLPWQSPTLQAAFALPVPKEYLDEAAEPVCVTFETIYGEQMKYIHDHLPLELLTTRKDPWLFAALRERLGSPEAVRLTGLLAHALYWIVLGHVHEPNRRLPALTSQSLVLTLQELWARLVEPIKRSVGRRGELLGRDSPAGICFVLPVFILTLKRGVERIFLDQYRKMLADPDVGLVLQDRLVDQLNLMMMNIFDPDCYYSNFGALDSSSVAIALWKKLFTLQIKLGLTPATRMLAREFRTTPMVLLLMNSDGSEPIDPKTRKHLQKSSSDSVLAAVAGIFPGDMIDQAEKQRKATKGKALAFAASPSMPRPRLDAGRRAALYRTARSRFSGLGTEEAARLGQKDLRAQSSSTPKLPSVKMY